MRATARPASIDCATLVKPATKRPALLAMLTDSTSRLPSSRSTRSGRSAETETFFLRLLANTLRRTASVTAPRVASTHTPRPGRRRARSGTMARSGPATKRMRSSGGFWTRETAQRRSGPLSSVSASSTAVREPIPCSSSPAHDRLRLGLGRHPCLRRYLCRLGGGGGSRLLGAHLVEVFLRNPAGGNAGRHDHVLHVLAGELEALEHALVAHGLGILLLLALRPAGKVVGLGAGQILEALDAVLSEGNEHRRRHALHLGKIVGDAELLALGIALGLLTLEIIARPRLNLAGGVLVEALDVGDLPGID